MKKIVTMIHTEEWEIDIPDNKVPKILEEYRENINCDAEENDLFEEIAYHRDHESVEGIGNLRDEGIIVSLRCEMTEFGFEERSQKKS